MTFPDAARLQTRVWLALDADLTDPATWDFVEQVGVVRYRPGVSLRMHRQDEDSQARSCEARLTLASPDGRYARRNPRSPLYGKLSMNTPIRIAVNPGDGDHVLFEGYVNEWPTRWADKTARDAAVPIVCSGILRRLTTAVETLKSTPRRYIPTTSPVAYWSLEDGTLATNGAPDVGSARLEPFLGQHPSGAVTSYPQWGAGSLGQWLPSVLSHSGAGGLAILSGLVSMPAFTSTWTVDVMYAATTAANLLAVDANPSYVFGGGFTGSWPQLLFNAVGTEIGFALNGEPEDYFTHSTLYDGKAHHIRWTLTQAGPNVSSQVWVDGVSAGSATTSGAMTLTAISTIALAALDSGDTGPSPVTVGHLGIWTSPPSLTTAVAAARGWADEQAHVRMARLLAEHQIAFQFTGTRTQAMGPQAPGRLVELLRECERVDLGLLYEHGFGLAYQSTSERYLSPPALELDFEARHIAELPHPADDDQRVRNKWTAQRTGGSGEATVARTSGPMGTGPGGPGEYAASTTVNCARDSQLPHIAGWLRHRGTVDEDRWPQLAIRLNRTPALIPAWVGMAPGSRLTAANPPVQVAPETIGAMVEGWASTWNDHMWDASLNTSPSSIYDVFVVASGSGNRSRIAAGPTVLAAGYDDSATALSVTSSVRRWIDSASRPAVFPMDIVIEGEVMSCTSIVGTGLTQALTVVRGTHGFSKALSSGATVQLWRPAAIAL